MKIKKIFRYVIIGSLLGSFIFYCGIALSEQPVKAGAKSRLFYVERVIDGDTIKLSNGGRVRFIGVDTPEVYYSNKLIRDAKKSKRDRATIQKLGRRASDFTKNLLNGKRVRLEYDVQRRDRYGRILAYVYIEDGTFVNAKLLEEGYAQVLTITPNVKYSEYFLKLQREARENKRGLWADN